MIRRGNAVPVSGAQAQPHQRIGMAIERQVRTSERPGNGCDRHLQRRSSLFALLDQRSLGNAQHQDRGGQVAVHQVQRAADAVCLLPDDGARDLAVGNIFVS